MFARILLVVLIVAVAWAVVARASPATGPERVYIVRPGDTLWSIAVRRYRGDPRAGVWTIEQRNGLRGGAIRPGERLMLP